MSFLRSAFAALAVIVGRGWTIVTAQQATPGPAAPTPPLARTNVRYYLPFGPSGLNPALKVTDRANGTCDSGSSVLPSRPDAWFCMEAGGVLDPCFENIWTPEGEPTQLACPSDPFGNEVVLLTAAAPLPQAPATPEAAATTPPLLWALELANGKQCGLLRGATAPFAGMRLNYGCVGGGSVIGDVDRSSPVWVVSYLDDGGLATNLVAVAVAWD
ncbi:MAG TPA: hypothetical protein VFU81_02945 [Thermomicrobiales bacterium]|nr:hypothetical protein [Thermomicrobiales bacterium]